MANTNIIRRGVPLAISTTRERIAQVPLGLIISLSLLCSSFVMLCQIVVLVYILSICNSHYCYTAFMQHNVCVCATARHASKVSLHLHARTAAHSIFWRDRHRAADGGISSCASSRAQLRPAGGITIGSEADIAADWFGHHARYRCTGAGWRPGHNVGPARRRWRPQQPGPPIRASSRTAPAL